MSDKFEDLRGAVKSAYAFGSDYPHPALLTRISAELRRGARPGPSPTWLAGAAASALTVLVIAGLVGPYAIRTMGSPAVTSPAPNHLLEAGMASILANNHLAYVAPGGATLTWDVALSPAPDLDSSHGYAGLGHRVAATADGRVIYALPAVDFRGGDQLVVVDSAAGRVIRYIQLPNPGKTARYGALAVGPSNDIWIVGSAGPVATVKELSVKRIVIVRVNHRDWSITSWFGRDMDHWQAQGPVGGDFAIFETQVSVDETRIYYSYSGGLLSESGLDWADIIGNQVTTCIPPNVTQACVPGLAGFFVQGSDVYITTGNDSPSGAIDYYAFNGTLRGHFQLGLLPGFLEDFALAPDGRSIYLFGSCGYSGGMARLDLATHASSVIVKAESQYTHSANSPCGQSSAFVSDQLIALGHVGALLPTQTEGKILYVNAAAGSVVRSVTVSAEPIAVTAVTAG
jgi:hypothetical protein